MQSMLKTKLRCHDRSNQVQFMTKTKQDNDVIDCISLIYVETKTELLGPL